MSTRICIVPAFWTPEIAQRHTCYDHSHSHVSFKECDDLRYSRRAIWLVAPDDKRHIRGILKFADTHAIRGFSCRYGALLASMRGETICRLLLSEITKRRMEDR